jgi:hypothetical protein
MFVQHDIADEQHTPAREARDSLKKGAVRLRSMLK